MGNSVAADTEIMDAGPVSTTVSAFYLAETEVTLIQWQALYNWANANGYSGLSAGRGKGPNHPVHTITWYDTVKWCNARSEQEGLTPIYYTNDAQTMIYRIGDVDVTNAQVKWTANGYRLPTEAEWEKAARGGLSGQRFPWGDTITHNQANYWSYEGIAYDVSSTRDFHPTYAVGDQPYTSPVGSFAANGYGLHDMAGNIWEWCWDWYGAYSSVAQFDPKGATTGSTRVFRGGSWEHAASVGRVAERYGSNPSYWSLHKGFRPARGL
jgi:formylglycine-generating enzyme required for sulfatase activity